MHRLILYVIINMSNVGAYSILYSNRMSRHLRLKKLSGQKSLPLCNVSIDVANDFAKNQFYFPDQFCPNLHIKLHRREKRAMKSEAMIPVVLPYIGKTVCPSVSKVQRRYVNKNNCNSRLLLRRSCATKSFDR
jgi:hypothetical protein